MSLPIPSKPSQSDRKGADLTRRHPEATRSTIHQTCRSDRGGIRKQPRDAVVIEGVDRAKDADLRNLTSRRPDRAPTAMAAPAGVADDAVEGGEVRPRRGRLMRGEGASCCGMGRGGARRREGVDGWKREPESGGTQREWVGLDWARFDADWMSVDQNGSARDNPLSK